MTRSIAWPLLTVATLSACYGFVPVGDRDHARTGSDVRVYLTPGGAGELAREIGPAMAMIEGRVVRYDPDTGLTLAVTQTRSMRGDQSPWPGDAPIVVPPSAIASVEERRLARGRTVVASTGATVALAVIGAYAVRRGGKGSGTGGPPPPDPP